LATPDYIKKYARKLKFPKYNRFEEIFNLKEIKAMTSVLDKLPDYIKKYARRKEKKLDLYLFLRTLKILGNYHFKLKILFRLC